MNRNNVGIILIILGIVFIIQNTGLINSDVLLSIVGIGLLIGYYYKRNIALLIGGFITLLIGISSITDSLIPKIELEVFIVLNGIGFIFLIMYFVKNKAGFIYPGCILPAIGTFALLEDIFTKDIGWVFFLLLSLSFYMIYIFEHRKNGYKWPLIPATILLIFSVLFLLSVKIIGIGIWTLLSYSWPLILILIGFRIIYNNKNESNKKGKF